MTDCPLDFVLPDFDGGGLLNLVASARRAAGATRHHTPLDTLPPEQMADHTNLVLLVIDGLGDEDLGQRGDSFLQRQRRRRLTSVFPSTTATAMTTLLTGLSPLEHGITGWHVWLRELGTVSAILPFRPRAGDGGLNHDRSAAGRVFTFPGFQNGLRAKATVFLPRPLVDSAYSRAAAAGARRIGFDSLEDGLKQLAQQARRPAQHAPRLMLLYWPHYDGVCHHHGRASPQARMEFERIDRALAHSRNDFKGSDTLFLATADHGQIDSDEAEALTPRDIDGLADDLRLPLCGEPRAAYLYLTADRQRHWRRHPSRHRQYWMACSEDLARSGWFGRGTPHPEFMHRIGDVTLVMRERATIRDRLVNEEPVNQVGVHGGLSASEMWVPLCVWHCG